MAEMEMHPLSSSNLQAAGYDEETNTLHVEFVGGGLYAYSGVPQETYVALMAAPSAGSFFHRAIRNRFPTERLE